jgi:hypothetical protein
MGICEFCSFCVSAGIMLPFSSLIPVSVCYDKRGARSVGLFEMADSNFVLTFLPYCFILRRSIIYLKESVLSEHVRHNNPRYSIIECICWYISTTGLTNSGFSHDSLIYSVGLARHRFIYIYIIIHASNGIWTREPDVRGVWNITLHYTTFKHYTALHYTTLKHYTTNTTPHHTTLQTLKHTTLTTRLRSSCRGLNTEVKRGTPSSCSSRNLKMSKRDVVCRARLKSLLHAFDWQMFILAKNCPFGSSLLHNI